jgi:general secretion pathway protein G
MRPREAADQCPERPESGYTAARESLLLGDSLPADRAASHEVPPWTANLDGLRFVRSPYHPRLGWSGGLVIVGVMIGLVAGWVGFPLVSHYEECKISTARINSQVLADAVEQYKANNGQYPASIEQLTEMQPNGQDPLVPREKIIDPWGKPYHLDPRGLRAKVSTTTPRGVGISSSSK